MTNSTLVTPAQLADAQAKANTIASSAMVAAPAASFKFLVLLDGTRNIASDLTISSDAQPTSIGQLNNTLIALREKMGVRLQLKLNPPINN